MSAPVDSGSGRCAWMMAVKSLSSSTASAMRFIVSTASIGYSPAADFGREHHSVGAFEDGGRDVGHLGARRHRRGDHALQHLRRDDRGLAEPPRQRG